MDVGRYVTFNVEEVVEDVVVDAGRVVEVVDPFAKRVDDVVEVLARVEEVDCWVANVDDVVECRVVNVVGEVGMGVVVGEDSAGVSLSSRLSQTLLPLLSRQQPAGYSM